MLSGEHYEDKWSARIDMSTIILEGNALTPLDLIFTDIDYHTGYVAGNLDVGVKFWNEKNFRLDLMAGIKFTHISIQGSTRVLGSAPIEGNREGWWVDPTLGLNFIGRPIKRTEFKIYADIGAFTGVELTSQVITEFNYFISSTFFMSVGYRYWYIKVPLEKAIYNGSIQGWVIRFGFQF